MNTASWLFLSAPEAPGLLDAVAATLARDPGQMCLVSLARARDPDTLRPQAMAHVEPAAHAQLQCLLDRARGMPADAFSRAVFGSGGALRLVIEDRRVLRLWLPAPYWPHVEDVGVSSVLASAIVCRTRVLGSILLWRQPGQPPFDAAEQEYLTALAGRLALAL